MSVNALYTDLSGYYDLLCSDVAYAAQSQAVHRLQQLFGNGGTAHLDLACGTGAHVRHFLDLGYHSSGLDINQPMLDQAAQRCPEAQFVLGDMASFSVPAPQDLITCFLYSMHYNPSVAALTKCFASVHAALAAGGVFCFNAVAKDQIDNRLFATHSLTHQGSTLTFRSSWYYAGHGEQQALKLRIEKHASENHSPDSHNAVQTEQWQDEHAMVAVSFAQLTELLSPYFDVHLLAHDYEKIVPCEATAGNALLVCVKR